METMFENNESGFYKQYNIYSCYSFIQLKLHVFHIYVRNWHKIVLFLEFIRVNFYSDYMQKQKSVLNEQVLNLHLY